MLVPVYLYGKDRCQAAERNLTQSFALAVPHEETTRIYDDVSCFQVMGTALSKQEGALTRTEEELEPAVRQITSLALASEAVIGIFNAADLDKPKDTVVSAEYLAKRRGMPHRNSAVVLLHELLRVELTIRLPKNVVQARSIT